MSGLLALGFDAYILTLEAWLVLHLVFANNSCLLAQATIKNAMLLRGILEYCMTYSEVLWSLDLEA